VRLIALSSIIILYVGIGVLSAVGSIAISTRRFSARTEQVFYGLLLAPIAAIYLAFTAHFAATDAWRLEAIAVGLFAILGFLGTRLSALLMLGYALHGGWDLVHEGLLYEGASGAGTSHLTQIPLAYGAFCAAYDWCMVGYFYTRRDQWKTAWQAR
jgi:hypothetical protein